MNKKTTISLKSEIYRNPRMVSSNLDGEVVMMSVENGEYYGLDEIGTRIWEILEKPLTVEELIDLLMKEFEVDRHQCESDTLEFLEHMVSKNLIRLHK